MIFSSFHLNPPSCPLPLAPGACVYKVWGGSWMTVCMSVNSWRESCVTVLTGCSDTGRISQEDDRKTFSVSLWSLHPSPPALPISPLHSLVSSRVGSACASVFFSPGTLSSLSAALHLHNHICVPLVCQVNLLVSGPSINNTLLDSFYFLLSGWWW